MNDSDFGASDRLANHFMLADADSADQVASARYGTYATEILINQRLKLGARRTSLEAKLVGGDRVVATLSSSQVGDKNASFVLDYLKTGSIPVKAQDLLDMNPCPVCFSPSNGRVLVKKLVRMHNDTVARREKKYANRLNEGPVAGDIELFT